MIRSDTDLKQCMHTVYIDYNDTTQYDSQRTRIRNDSVWELVLDTAGRPIHRFSKNSNRGLPLKSNYPFLGRYWCLVMPGYRHVHSLAYFKGKAIYIDIQFNLLSQCTAPVHKRLIILYGLNVHAIVQYSCNELMLMTKGERLILSLKDDGLTDF